MNPRIYPLKDTPYMSVSYKTKPAGLTFLQWDLEDDLWMHVDQQRILIQRLLNETQA